MKTTINPALDALILLMSGAGIAVSTALAAWGIAVAPNALQAPALGFGVATLVGVLPVGALFVLRQQAKGILAPPDYSGCPAWLRLLCNVLMIAGVALFFLPAVLQFCGIGPAFNGSELPSTLPGGFGLAIYTGIFGQAYSSAARRERSQSEVPPAT
ncbi:hypothetical protein [Scleromatobacter humisilvae]|uniref:Uncharacterized protein n=1 Tax=Scleromatobacter humisilvae TaxID=2897159 RepID=A0A9X1YME4_9BURK|nr:hypothetical protein [Scleromatobacter humisilvae]MCK9687067.1 hypothetical protein [Scleromatobacter humisilvae]